MLFNSYGFVFVFLPITFGIYFLLNHQHRVLPAKIWLIAASLFFYAWWDIAYLPLLVGSIVVNYMLGQKISVLRGQYVGKGVSPKQLLIIGLALNLGLLGYFKYAGFFVSNVAFLLDAQTGVIRMVLPLAISFYTITQIAYLIDVYEGLAEEKGFTDYALFVTFFPHLIAGPIVHNRDLMPQFARINAKSFDAKNVAVGLFVFSIGLCKKTVIADSFAGWANKGFDDAPILTFIEAWVTSISYTMQLYFDFSGYSDMAIGLGLLFNIRLPQNFNSPYKALGIIDFWKRWHITLTNFITTYVYTPIVRSFGSPTWGLAMVAIMLSMLISGLWHGAAWTFVAWGGLHGGALVINHWWRRSKLKMPQVLAWLITFTFVNASFVFFRAQNWGDAFKVLKGMSGFNGVELPITLASLWPSISNYGIKFGAPFAHIEGNKWTMVAIVLGFVIVAFKNSTQIEAKFRPYFTYALWFGACMLMSMIAMLKVSPFIYFNF